MFNSGNIFSLFGGNPKVLKITSPNGGVYHYSTNTLDEKTFETYEIRLQEAVTQKDQVLFDQIWSELTTQQKETPNPFDQDIFKKLQGDIEKVFGDKKSPFGSGLFGSPLANFGSKDLTIDEIDEKIHELQQLRDLLQANENKENAAKKVAELKVQLDEKLLTLSEVTDAKKKQQLTDELTALYKEIKELEAVLND